MLVFGCTLSLVYAGTNKNVGIRMWEHIFRCIVWYPLSKRYWTNTTPFLTNPPQFNILICSLSQKTKFNNTTGSIVACNPFMLSVNCIEQSETELAVHRVNCNITSRLRNNAPSFVAIGSLPSSSTWTR